MFDGPDVVLDSPLNAVQHPVNVFEGIKQIAWLRAIVVHDWRVGVGLVQ